MGLGKPLLWNLTFTNERDVSKDFSDKKTLIDFFVIGM
jgi:hypothetical protein